MLGSPALETPVSLSDGKFGDMRIRFETVPECDGQTDVRICHNDIALCIHRHADAR